MDDLCDRLAEIRRGDQFAELFTEDLEETAACCSNYACQEE